MKKYFWNLLISIDQLVNTIFWGDPDETISSRLGRKLMQKREGCCKWRKRLCKILSFLDPADGNHCVESIEEEFV